MNVETFKPYKHLKHIERWIMARGIEKVFTECLPKEGYIAFEKDHALAAVFIRKIEKSGCAMIDSLITNPAESAELRDEAINLVVSNILKRAAQLKLKSVMGFSTDEHTLERSQKLGFTVKPEQIVALKLEGKSL